MPERHQGTHSRHGAAEIMCHVHTHCMQLGDTKTNLDKPSPPAETSKDGSQSYNQALRGQRNCGFIPSGTKLTPHVTAPMPTRQTIFQARLMQT